MALSNDLDNLVKIKCFGVGGGGCNAVTRMAAEASPGVEYIAVNTDAQALMRCEVPFRLRIGDSLTRGLGAGGNPELGQKAAEESRDDIYDALKGADMVFVAAGMGGGTGTGAAPVIAQVARETGALTIAIVTRPFSFEGVRRARQAEDGITRLRESVDSLIIIPNDRLLNVAGVEASWQEAFRLADSILQQGVHAISELVTIPGEINLDFADVKNIMAHSGQALMATGTGRGNQRAVDAAKSAISNPLLEVDISGAKGVLFNITGSTDLALSEIHNAADIITQAVDPEANIIFGVVPDPTSDGEVRLTLIATGFQTSGPTVESERVDSILREALGDTDLDLPPFLRRKSRRLGH